MIRFITLLILLVPTLSYGAASIVPAFGTISSATGGKVSSGQTGSNTLNIVGGTVSKIGTKPTLTIPAVPSAGVTAVSAIAGASVSTPLSDSFFGYLDGATYKKISYINLRSSIRGTVYDVIDYGSLATAVASIGSTSATLQFSADATVSANLVIPSNIELMPLNGAVINHTTYTISYAGSTARWPLAQVFNGTGAVTFQDGALSVVFPQWWGAKGDGVTDDTTAVQSAINAYRSVHFPFGRYMVSSISFNKPGGNYTFDGAIIRGNATVATAFVVEITTSFLNFTNLLVDQNFNPNYTAAVKWHSLTAGTPAQYNVIDGLYISNAKIGILYGQINGTAVVDAAQSENDIYRFITRGVEKAIYYNQSNGALRVHGGAYGVSKAEWDTNSPGVFDYSTARVVEQYQGSLELFGCELLGAENSNIIGLEIKGGVLNISGGQWEIAGTNLLLSNCNVNISAIGSAYFSSGTLPFIELVNASTGSLLLNNLRLVKATGTDANDQAFIKTNSTPGWTVVLNNSIANKQQRTSIVKSSGANNTYLTNIKFSNFLVRGTAGDVDISSSASNLIDTIKGNALATLKNLWWLAAGSGGLASLDTVDVPVVAGRTYANSLKLDGTGTDRELLTIDRTSNATVVATGIPITNGRWYLIEGWMKHEGAGTTSLRIISYDNAFSPSGLVVMDSSTLIGTDWTYVRALYQMPSSSEYVGIGMKCVNSIGRMIDMKISRVD